MNEVDEVVAELEALVLDDEIQEALEEVRQAEAEEDWERARAELGWGHMAVDDVEELVCDGVSTTGMMLFSSVFQALWFESIRSDVDWGVLLEAMEGPMDNHLRHRILAVLEAQRPDPEVAVPLLQGWITEATAYAPDRVHLFITGVFGPLPAIEDFLFEAHHDEAGERPAELIDMVEASGERWK